MTRYTIADRVWVPGPGGILVSVIPGRELVSTLDPLPELAVAVDPPGAMARYLVEYLTRYGPSTVRQMAPADGRFTQSSLSGCLSAHPELFRGATTQGQKQSKIWRLRVQP